MSFEFGLMHSYASHIVEDMSELSTVEENHPLLLMSYEFGK